jgi:hypothetical protein
VDDEKLPEADNKRLASSILTSNLRNVHSIRVNVSELLFAHARGLLPKDQLDEAANTLVSGVFHGGESRAF